MNTLTNTAAYVEETGNIIILLDGLEFGMPEDQLDEITALHNNGKEYKEISKIVGRNPYEVILALLHQVKSGKGMRSMYGH